MIPDQPDTQAERDEVGWRIDELAQRAGVTVDTIRFYRREGLLAPGTRVGRTRRFGPDHLCRLERIHDLRERRFSLAAIRAVLDASESGAIAGLFGDGDGSPGAARGLIGLFEDGGPETYTFDELCERAALDRELAVRLRAAGVPKDPALVGREGFDARDLDAVRALAELRELGVPDDLLVSMARLWCDGLARMQTEIVALFAHLGAEERGAVRDAVARRAPDLVPASSRLVGYVHVRTIQQLMLRAMRDAENRGS